MKIVFMGTPEFALPALQRLIDSPHEVCLVLTQPDRPKGRGRKLQPSAVKQLALEHDLPVLEPRKLLAECVADKIREAGADLAVVAAYGRILPKAVLDAPRLGCINIHPSMLPEYRGAAPLQRCILDGFDWTGVSLIMLVEDLDAGPIVAQQRVEILADDDSQSLGEMCAVVGADMLMHVIDEAEKNGHIDSIEQNHEEATYTEPIKKEEGLIPWSDPTDNIMYRLRAMTPWPGAYTFINGKTQLQIIQAEPLWENEIEQLGERNNADPGTVTSIKKIFGFTVKTGDGELLVTSVKPQGKRIMDATAFVNGRSIKVGDRLSESAES